MLQTPILDDAEAKLRKQLAETEPDPQPDVAGDETKTDDTKKPKVQSNIRSPKNFF